MNDEFTSTRSTQGIGGSCGGPLNSRPMFTVFTPTFNRSKTLSRVFDALRGQTYGDFEWVIVDDGSTDDTAAVVAEMRNTAPFPVRFFQQQHGHKKTAVNRGVQEARGDFFLCWDSDDSAPNTTLADMVAAWQAIPTSERLAFCGVWGLCATPSGDIVGSRFPADVFDSNHAAIRHCHRCHGEKWGFVRTSVMRDFPYPQNIRGYVPEGVVWARIGQHYQTRYINKILRVYYDESDSLTRARSHAWTNAPGLALWACEVLRSEAGWFWWSPSTFVHSAVNVTRFRWHAWVMGVSISLPTLCFSPKALVALFYPLGLFVFFSDYAGKRLQALFRRYYVACGGPRAR